jgi:hypothetical protein
MKRVLILMVLIFSFATLVHADVTGEIIGKSIDENGNIVIQTQYKIDGVEVPSRYPQLDGKYYWVTRYSMQNFYGMSDADILVRIQKDIIQFGQSLISKKYVTEENTKLELKGVVGSTVTVTSADITVSKDLAITVKTDGSLPVEKVIVSTTLIP